VALHQLMNEPASEWVLDLRDVTFLDTAGIRLLLPADRGQKQAGHTLTVVPGEGGVERVFAVSGLTSILKIVPRSTREEGDTPTAALPLATLLPALDEERHASAAEAG
jgi:anti-anti-sigma factor